METAPKSSWMPPSWDHGAWYQLDKLWGKALERLNPECAAACTALRAQFPDAYVLPHEEGSLAVAMPTSSPGGYVWFMATTDTWDHSRTLLAERITRFVIQKLGASSRESRKGGA